MQQYGKSNRHPARIYSRGVLAASIAGERTLRGSETRPLGPPFHAFPHLQTAAAPDKIGVLAASGKQRGCLKSILHGK
jgi:hypothetical protein